MKKLMVIAMLALATPAFANVLVNGDWSTGDETGWTRWRAPWGSTEGWAVTSGGPTAPEGTLFGSGGNGSYGWYQVVAVPASEMVTVTADWKGDIGGAGWAEVMLYTSADPNANWGNLADSGGAGDIAFKKDSWGMNPPTAWGWQAASLSPHPSGNGGTIHSLGYVCVALKLGGFPMGTVSFDNIILTPEPAAALLLLAGLPLLRRRRA